MSKSLETVKTALEKIQKLKLCSIGTLMIQMEIKIK